MLSLLILLHALNIIAFNALLFSVGALAGLICFVLTPLYLSWLLVYELGNGLTWLRWYYRCVVEKYILLKADRLHMLGDLIREITVILVDPKVQYPRKGYSTTTTTTYI